MNQYVNLDSMPSWNYVASMLNGFCQTNEPIEFHWNGNVWVLADQNVYFGLTGGGIATISYWGTAAGLRDEINSTSEQIRRFFDSSYDVYSLTPPTHKEVKKSTSLTSLIFPLVTFGSVGKIFLKVQKEKINVSLGDVVINNKDNYNVYSRDKYVSYSGTVDQILASIQQDIKNNNFKSSDTIVKVTPSQVLTTKK